MKKRVSFNKTSIKAVNEKADNAKKEAGAMLILRRLRR